MNIILVGLGGGLGAICRYLMSMIHVKGTFPLVTLGVNLIGAFVIGFIVGSSEKNGMSSQMELFLKVGLCGGFTTFSTFSLEAYNLMKAGSYMQMGVYALGSVVLCIAGVTAGMYVSKKI